MARGKRTKQGQRVGKGGMRKEDGRRRVGNRGYKGIGEGFRERERGILSQRFGGKMGGGRRK